MFRNYFNTAWRSLSKDKLTSFINILGLSIGIMCTILIMLWVNDEKAYDKFHSNYKNIYQIMANRNFDGKIFTDQNMPLPLASAIETDIPQVKRAVVASHQQQMVIKNGDALYRKNGYTVSTNFFDIFTWKFIKGDPQTALSDIQSIVLTKSAAQSIFGDEDPTNKTIRFDNQRDLKVTAIVEDPPANSSFQFDYLNTFNTSSKNYLNNITNWQSSYLTVFIQLEDKSQLTQIEESINAIKKSNTPGGDKVSNYFAFPMSKWHLESEFDNGVNAGGMIEYVNLFTTVAIIILLVACINFMNLSTAKSEKRSKEVGIRKAIGSTKTNLIFQYLTESFMVSFFAFAVAIILTFVALPHFNYFVNKNLSININDPVNWIAGITIFLVTAILSGSYPAFYLSSFKPISVLKGRLVSSFETVLLRKSLVILQFSISVLLIISTIIVFYQIKSIKHRDIGYDPSNLLMLPASEDTRQNNVAIKQELLNSGMIEGVTRIYSPLTESWMHDVAPDWTGKPANMQILFAPLFVDHEFTKTLKIKVIQGTDFTGNPSDSSSVLLNQTALKIMKIKNPIGSVITWGGKEYNIKGIVNDFIMSSPYTAAEPMMFLYLPEELNSINIKLKAGVSPKAALPVIENIFKKYNPENPFEYKFVDEEFGKKFIAEEFIGKITNLFGLLTVFISCLGLFGLATFSAEQRTKEIGIRKVLGASVSGIASMFSKDFLKLVFIALIIASPVAWYLMNKWLQSYEYRINISWWIFAVTAIGVLLIALITVSFQAIKAAIANPVKSLRTE